PEHRSQIVATVSPGLAPSAEEQSRCQRGAGADQGAVDHRVRAPHSDAYDLGGPQAPDVVASSGGDDAARYADDLHLFFTNGRICNPGGHASSEHGFEARLRLPRRLSRNRGSGRQNTQAEHHCAHGHKTLPSGNAQSAGSAAHGPRLRPIPAVVGMLVSRNGKNRNSNHEIKIGAMNIDTRLALLQAFTHGESYG